MLDKIERDRLQKSPTKPTYTEATGGSYPRGELAPKRRKSLTRTGGRRRGCSMVCARIINGNKQVIKEGYYLEVSR